MCLVQILKNASAAKRMNTNNRWNFSIRKGGKSFAVFYIGRKKENKVFTSLAHPQLQLSGKKKD
jgi:hypothetical protein